MNRVGELLIGLGLWLVTTHRGPLTLGRCRYWGAWAVQRLNDLSDVERNALVRATKHTKPHKRRRA